MNGRFLCILAAFCAAILLLCCFSVGWRCREPRFEAALATRSFEAVAVAKTGNVRLLRNNVFIIDLTPAQQKERLFFHGCSLLGRERLFALYFNIYPNCCFFRKDNVPPQAPDGINSEIRFRWKLGQVADLFKPKTKCDYFARSSSRVPDANFTYGDMGRVPEQIDPVSFSDNAAYPSALGIDDRLGVELGCVGGYFGGISSGLGQLGLFFQIVQSSFRVPDGEARNQDQSPIRPKRVSPFREWAFWRLLLGFIFLFGGNWLLRYRANRWLCYLSCFAFVLGGCLLFGPRLPQREQGQQKQRECGAITHGR